MFTPDDFSNDPKFEKEMEKDISEESLKFGEIEKITLFAKNPKGIVLVRYKTSVAAEECRKTMEGRFFAKRRLRSYYWDGVTNYSLFTEVTSSSSTSASSASGLIGHISSNMSGGSSRDSSGNSSAIKANSKSKSNDEDNGDSNSDDEDLDDDEREEKQRLEEFGSMLDNQDDLPAEFRLRTE